MLRSLLATLVFGFAFAPLAATAGVFVLTMTPNVSVPAALISHLPGGKLFAECDILTADGKPITHAAVPLPMHDGKSLGGPVTVTVDTTAEDALFKPSGWACFIAVESSPKQFNNVASWLTSNAQGKKVLAAGPWVVGPSDTLYGVKKGQLP